MNSMNDSGYFQDAESNYSQSGVQENVFFLQINYLRLIQDIFRKEFHPNTCRENREAVPGDTKVGQNYGTIPMPMFATKPMTSSSKRPVDILQNYVVGQQRQQISELQFDEFPHPQSFLNWKTRFETQVSSGSDLKSDAMLWVKEVEMALDELKSSRSVHGKDFLDFEMLDTKIASALNKIVQNFSSQFQKEGQPRRAESPNRGSVPERETNRLHDLRLLSSDWRS